MELQEASLATMLTAQTTSLLLVARPESVEPELQGQRDQPARPAPPKPPLLLVPMAPTEWPERMVPQQVRQPSLVPMEPTEPLEPTEVMAPQELTEPLVHPLRAPEPLVPQEPREARAQQPHQAQMERKEPLVLTDLMERQSVPMEGQEWQEPMDQMEFFPVIPGQQVATAKATPKQAVLARLAATPRMA